MAHVIQSIDMMNFNSPLLTDFYQLTMMDSYHRLHQNKTAVFELFFRNLPTSRHFLIAAGLETVMHYLNTLRFSADELDWLKSHTHLSADFLSHLKDFSFTGSVWAVPEGTPVFAQEPILRIIAPIMEAQLIESRLINIMHYQTLIASKAIRSRLVAPHHTLLDFGFRRAHGAEAGLWAARSSYMAGFNATATVQASRQYGIPLSGTMAHSFVQAHDNERQAFLDFARTYPDRAIFLIDTYHVLQGVQHAIEATQQLSQEGIAVLGVRVDSGDLLQDTRKIRGLLDNAHLHELKIFVSGNMNEYEIDTLLKAGAPIDGFGVGTELSICTDQPALDCVYKIQEYDGIPKRKLSPKKVTWPGRKQVYRFSNEAEIFEHDVISLERASPAEIKGGHPLLKQVMDRGEWTQPMPTLSDIRAYVTAQMAKLPPALKTLSSSESYPILLGNSLKALIEK